MVLPTLPEIGKEKREGESEGGFQSGHRNPSALGSGDLWPQTGAAGQDSSLTPLSTGRQSSGSQLHQRSTALPTIMKRTCLH